MEDVLMLEHADGLKIYKKWQDNYMQNLTDFVIQIADNADLIPKWLQ